jgi:hypothetical protein
LGNFGQPSCTREHYNIEINSDFSPSSIEFVTNEYEIQTFKCFFLELLSKQPSKMEEYFAYFLDVLKALDSLREAKFVFPWTLMILATKSISSLKNSVSRKYNLSVTEETKDLGAITFTKIIIEKNT